MESWLTPSIIATAAATLILSLVYWYLYSQERNKYMRTWAVGWLFYSFRMAFMLVIVQGASSQVWGIANHFCSLMNTFLILGGCINS